MLQRGHALKVSDAKDYFTEVGETDPLASQKAWMQDIPDDIERLLVIHPSAECRQPIISFRFKDSGLWAAVAYQPSLGIFLGYIELPKLLPIDSVERFPFPNEVTFTGHKLRMEIPTLARNLRENDQYAGDNEWARASVCYIGFDTGHYNDTEYTNNPFYILNQLRLFNSMLFSGPMAKCLRCRTEHLTVVDPNGTISVPAVVGEIIDRVEGLRDGSDSVKLFFRNHMGLRIMHCPDCCETVEIVDIVGDVSDLVGAPVLEISIVSSTDHPDFVTILEGNQGVSVKADRTPIDISESSTWSVVKLRTTKGEVNLRWLGQSNGYYSEIPDIVLFDATVEDDEQLSFPLPEKPAIEHDAS